METMYLGFTFYGNADNSNIGDDLMLAGFIRSLKILGRKFKLIPSCSDFAIYQKIRFPEVLWKYRTVHDYLRNQPIKSQSLQSRYWVGVGGTPFQLSCGDWAIKFFKNNIMKLNSFPVKIMINVGAESEIKPRHKDFSIIAKTFDKISARDAHSASIIRCLGVAENKIFTGADLSNIVLSDFGNKNVHKPFKLGIVLASDSLSFADLRAVATFLKRLRYPAAFIPNEVKEDSFVYVKLLFYFPWAGLDAKIKLLMPPYLNGKFYQLLKPYSLCETVISARYHALLTAAWFGCKVAAIARTSKVLALAKLLNVPYCDLPITYEKLNFLQKKASRVPRDILVGLKEKALEGVSFALDIG